MTNCSLPLHLHRLSNRASGVWKSRFKNLNVVLLTGDAPTAAKKLSVKEAPRSTRLSGVKATLSGTVFKKGTGAKIMIATPALLKRT
jgi:hypothetical protein